MANKQYMIIGIDQDGIRAGLVTFEGTNSTMKFNEQSKATEWIQDNPQNGITLKVVEYDREYERSQFQ